VKVGGGPADFAEQSSRHAEGDPIDAGVRCAAFGSLRAVRPTMASVRDWRVSWRDPGTTNGLCFIIALRTTDARVRGSLSSPGGGQAAPMTLRPV
jgi:hypothetical protein